jgi:hypothetical protein
MTANLVLALAATALPACSSQQWYGAGQAWQRNECFKLSDAQERSRCLARASVDRDRYERDARRAADGD